MATKKNLLIIANTPSPNTSRLVSAILEGALHDDIQTVTATHIEPLKVAPEDILSADAIILGTTENLGYMSGLMKDVFDRCYYPCLEKKQGLPCAAYIRAGHDGTGALKGLRMITTGLKWRWVQEPIILRGDFHSRFEKQCIELGAAMASALDQGII